MSSILDSGGRPMPQREEDKAYLLDPEKNPNAVLDTAIAVAKESWCRYWICMKRRPLRTLVLSWMMFAFVVLMRSCVGGTAESLVGRAERISFEDIDPSNPAELGSYLGASFVGPGTKTGSTIFVSAIAGGDRPNRAQLAKYKRKPSRRISTQMASDKKSSRQRTTLVRY